MVAPAFAMARDVPPMAKLPRSTGSAGSAGGMGFTSADTFFPTTQRVVKHFLGSKHMLVDQSYVSKYGIVISVCTQCIKINLFPLKLNFVSCFIWNDLTSKKST